MFFLTERWAVLANPQRGAPAMTLSAAPFVIALFYAPPLDLLAGYLAGALLASATRRPVAVAQSAFGLARFTFFAALAELVFRAVPSDGTPTDWRAWLAAVLAMA